MLKYLKVLLLLISVGIIAGCDSQPNSKVPSNEFIYKTIDDDTLKAFVFNDQSIKSPSIKPAIIIFHGGGWFIGEPSWMFGIAEEYAKKGLIAAVIEYRLSDRKEITPIDAIDDACDAVIWIKNHANELSVNPDSLITYGWSAGGHLAACTAIFPKTDSITNVTSIPAAMIFYTSALSVVKDTWFERLLLGKAVPITYSPAENIKENIPACIIISAEDDLTTPLSESQLFHDNMLKYNNQSKLVIYEDIGHLLSHSEEDLKPDKQIQRKAYNEIDVFLRDLKFIR